MREDTQCQLPASIYMCPYTFEYVYKHTCYTCIHMLKKTTRPTPSSSSSVNSLLWWTVTKNCELNKPFLPCITFVRVFLSQLEKKLSNLHTNTSLYYDSDITGQTSQYYWQHAMKYIVKPKAEPTFSLVDSLHFSFHSLYHSIFWQHQRNVHRKQLSLLSLGCSIESRVEGNSGKW